MKPANYAALAIVLAAASLLIIYWEPPQNAGKEFCGKANVAEVLSCRGYVEVISSLLGGGSTYYRDDGTRIHCPVVGPDSMSAECRKIFEAKLNSSGIFCTDLCIKVTDFESCAAAGYPVMESYPRQCRANGITYVEKTEIACKPEQRNAEVCIALYEPVCAKVNVQCIRAPCDPVYETFSNSCEACKNSFVESYRMGEC